MFGTLGTDYMQQKDFLDGMKQYCGLQKAQITHLIWMPFEFFQNIQANDIIKGQTKVNHRGIRTIGSEKELDYIAITRERLTSFFMGL